MNGTSTPRKTYEEHQAEKSDRAVFFCILGMIIVYAAGIFELGFLPASMVLGGMIFLFGAAVQLGR